jgi:hypothetical protein
MKSFYCQGQWLILVILATREAEIGRMEVQGQHRQTVHETISKIPRTKWTGSVAQVMECLLCKCKALSSNPSPTGKKFLFQSQGKKKAGYSDSHL